MRTTVLIGALLLTGCDTDLSPRWDSAPYRYTCTADEQSRVQVETKWCKDNTDYLSTYCYGAATMRICTPKNSQASRP